MESESKDDANSFSRQIGEKEKRKLKAQREKKRSIWFGLGMFGMIGWSIAVPTFLGVLFGIWLDKIDPEPFSWTVTFLMLGIISGCLIAWHWVSKEDKEMNKSNDEPT